MTIKAIKEKYKDYKVTGNEKNMFTTYDYEDGNGKVVIVVNDCKGFGKTVMQIVRVSDGKELLSEGKSDMQCVINAVEKKGQDYIYADAELRKNEEVIKAALRNDRSVVAYISENILDKMSLKSRIHADDLKKLPVEDCLAAYSYVVDDISAKVIGNYFDKYHQEYYKFFGKNIEKTTDDGELRHYEYTSAEDMVNDWIDICKTSNDDYMKNGLSKPFIWC